MLSLSEDDPGDPVVELTKLKQAANVVGPLTLLHDNWGDSSNDP